MDARPLARRLGLIDLLGVVMGAIIGVGIFFQPGVVMDRTGSATVALAAWGLGGAIALVGSLTFAELGGLFPRTGGQYHVLEASFGRPVAFLYCWSLLAVIQSGAVAIIAMICVQFAATAMGLVAAESSQQLWGAILIAGLTWINVRGVKGGGRLAAVTSGLKILMLLAIIFVGLLVAGEPSQVGERLPRGDGRWALLLPGLVPVLFSYGGWQQGTYVAGEVENPERNVPLAIIGGVLGVVLLYVLYNFALIRSLSPSEMVSAGQPVAAAMEARLGTWGGRMTALFVAASAFGVAAVCIMTAPRMYKAMSDDGCFFAAFGGVHPRHRTPAPAILAQGGVAILLVVLAGRRGVEYLTTGVVCVDWIFFTLTAIALFVLRRRRPDASRPYRAWGYPVLPAVFVLASGVAVAATFLDAATRSASVVAVAVVVTGLFLYALRTGFRSR
ncbi:MAG TPA: amino acid permease [Planctomycetes bacterium]|nr:amino acid permease [Planctomycetota bacterium]